ncbi:MAG: GGDEF domain-containing protein [Bdellovibrio sp.]
MILTPEIRAKFSVFLFLEDLDQGTDLRGHLAVSGYEVFLFRDQDTVVSRIKEAAPHVVIFEIEALQTTLSEFVEKALEANPEVMFLPMASVSQALALNEYREHNFAGLLTKGDDRDLRALWSVDQICSELFFQFQNEQLLDQFANLKRKIETQDMQISQLDGRKRELESAESFRVKTELGVYGRAKSKEEILDAFLHQLEQKCLHRNLKLCALVLKFLPTVQSFVATQALGLDLEKIKGVGARLEKKEAQDLLGLLEAGQFPGQLIQLLEQGLSVKNFVGKPLMLPDAIEALMVFWSPNGILKAEDFENEYLIFQIAYQNLHLARRLSETDTRDSVTDLEGREFYFKKVDEEIARARRLQKAVSVVKISIDHLPEIEQSFGVGNRNAVLRTVATLIKRTSRINDYSCRTDDNEISLVLPHCPRKGAAIRAERIRRMIENHSFNLSGHRVTLSCGISEYPTLCSSSEELEQTTQQALSFIQEKGGNKVCLYRARQDFKPDFDVPPV